MGWSRYVFGFVIIRSWVRVPPSAPETDKISGMLGIALVTPQKPRVSDSFTQCITFGLGLCVGFWGRGQLLLLEATVCGN